MLIIKVNNKKDNKIKIVFLSVKCYNGLISKEANIINKLCEIL